MSRLAKELGVADKTLRDWARQVDADDRPECRNAFRPQTVDELYRALDHAQQWSDVGCVLLTGSGPSPKDGGWAFCSGVDQRIRGKDGYKYEGAEGGADPARLGRLHILEVQRRIRCMPKVVGGEHVPDGVTRAAVNVSIRPKSSCVQRVPHGMPFALQHPCPMHCVLKLVPCSTRNSAPPYWQALP